MYDPSGNYSALFSLEPDVSLDFVSGNNQDSRENKPNCYIAGVFPATARLFIG